MSKPVSIEKLQAFIEAVEFAADLENPDEWIPSPRQWKKIRSMIDALEVPEAPVAVAAPVRYDAPVPVTYAAPSSLAPVAPAVNAVDIIAQRAATGAIPQPGGGLLGGDGLRVKTPDIDTTSGSYQSAFL